MWKKVIAGIENKLGGVNLENILEIEVLFRNEITKVVGVSTNSNYEYSHALGFIRDEEKGEFEFSLRVSPRKRVSDNRNPRW